MCLTCEKALPGWKRIKSAADIQTPQVWMNRGWRREPSVAQKVLDPLGSKIKRQLTRKVKITR